ncbi:hypothetical protein RFI_30953 [Reticulomyxa filosa]|uniref:Uncharacterized protein n=1 Tax=Reticulomyxa filosa TaxID=46433 RepID=X6LXW5_RETFI|nr:hypothetical protein RFI_30953 [Reticulomyxa filosa]|eukprot:ETO06439.1 hypothetical protein RFI_30953 [Reticulomyxa filosa]
MVAHISGAHEKAFYNEKDPTIPMLIGRPKGVPDPKHVVSKTQFLIGRKNLLMMGFVGITERYEESLAQMSHLLNNLYNLRFHPPKHKKINENRKKPKEKPSKQVIDVILKYNHWDMLLYQLGLVLFEQQRIVIKYLFTLANHSHSDYPPLLVHPQGLWEPVDLPLPRQPQQNHTFK